MVHSTLLLFNLLIIAIFLLAVVNIVYNNLIISENKFYYFQSTFTANGLRIKQRPNGGELKNLLSFIDAVG